MIYMWLVSFLNYKRTHPCRGLVTHDLSHMTCHIWLVTYDLSHIRMHHVTYNDASRHTNISFALASCVICKLFVTWLILTWVTSHTGMSHVTKLPHLPWARVLCVCHDMTHPGMSHVTRKDASCHTIIPLALGPCVIPRHDMTHPCMSHVTHKNVSCHK